MKVHYADRSLEKLCTNEREARKRRSDIADKLRLRVNALELAEDVGQLQTLDPLGNWHELKADRPGCWAGKLSRNWRLIFWPEVDDAVAGSEAADDDEAADGADATKATEVTVVEIVDYH